MHIDLVTCPKDKLDKLVHSALQVLDTYNKYFPVRKTQPFLSMWPILSTFEKYFLYCSDLFGAGTLQST